MTACFIDSGLEHGNFLNSDISQGNVVTQVRCGRIINNGFVANLLMDLSLEEFWKSVNIWRSYGQYYSGLFFIDSQCISCASRSPQAKKQFLAERMYPHARQHSTDTTVSCAKMAELIEMPFGLWTRVGPRQCVRCGARWCNLANTTEPSMCGGDAAFCQITLTTCY